MLTKDFAILGYGVEGQALWRFWRRQFPDAIVHIYDQNPWPGGDYVIPESNWHSGSDYIAQATQHATVGRSPGLPFMHPDLQSALSRGVDITSQTKLFFANCPCPIIGITGTKGKGTTTSLIAQMLERTLPALSGPHHLLSPQTKIWVTGNIGKDQALDLLPQIQPHDVVVFELSSFQLQDLNQSPHIGVCLMITTDHLDKHLNLEEYHQAKSAIAAFQSVNDIVVYNQDFPASVKIAQFSPGRHFGFSTQAHPQQDNCLVQIIDGALIGHGDYTWVNALPWMNRGLLGQHNLQNYAAAILAATAAGASPAAVAQTVADFHGLPHRLQLVGVYHGVKFIDDSISTNPDTAIAALSSLSEPLWLILGGSDKGLDFQVLAEACAAATHVRGVVVIGQIADRIQQALQQAGFTKSVLLGATNMSEVINLLAPVLQSGDTVLLSPATASFDWFKNYADRGQQFAEAAAAWRVYA